MHLLLSENEPAGMADSKEKKQCYSKSRLGKASAPLALLPVSGDGLLLTSVG
jgi:hypothetical protein